MTFLVSENLSTVKNRALKKIAFAISFMAVSASVMLLSTATLAQNCDYPRDDFDGLYCLSKVYQQADKDLNSSYQELVKQLNSNQKAILKRGQLAWIRDRNDRCSEYTEDSFLVNMRCATDTTTNRVNFLNERLRECRAGSCRTSRLDD